MPTAALVLGIVSIFIPGFVFGILAIIFGALGRQQTAPFTNERAKSLWGIWLGIASLVISILVTAAIVAALRPSDPTACFYGCS